MQHSRRYNQVTVRQTPDPFVDDVQYTAYSKVTLKPNGDLDFDQLSFGKPGDHFAAIIGTSTYGPKYRTNVLDAFSVRLCMTLDDNLCPVITVVEGRNMCDAEKRYGQRLYDQEIAERLAILKGLVTQTWSWLASNFHPTTSDDNRTVPSTSLSPDDSIPITYKEPVLANADSVPTCIEDGARLSGLAHRKRTAKDDDFE